MSRDEILNSIRRRLPEAVELPALEGDWIEYDDPRARFGEMLRAVGGRAIVVPDAAAANEALSELDPWRKAAKRCSLVKGVGETNFELAAVADPHELEDVDFAVLPGRFGVAENGAVWVTGEDFRDRRVLYFLAQHVALVVPAGEIVSNMHQAYERLTFERPGFGTFISGPSKTADIEQSLVIGAHGARSLTVLLVED